MATTTARPVDRAAPPRPPRRRGLTFWQRLRRDKLLLLFALPGMAVILADRKSVV